MPAIPAAGMRQLTYSGWWFVQRIRINNQPVWRKVSWLRIDREIEIRLPPQVDPDQRPLRIEINFGPALRIRRFRVWLGGQPIYDEEA
ncbi:hypothetical protein [Rubripirellula lacrimiformis]|nr:hypothetical protein [Rubripirellula lacrimiformis]